MYCREEEFLGGGSAGCVRAGPLSPGCLDASCSSGPLQMCPSLGQRGFQVYKVAFAGCYKVAFAGCRASGCATAGSPVLVLLETWCLLRSPGALNRHPNKQAIQFQLGSHSFERPAGSHQGSKCW